RLKRPAFFGSEALNHWPLCHAIPASGQDEQLAGTKKPSRQTASMKTKKALLPACRKQSTVGLSEVTFGQCGRAEDRAPDSCWRIVMHIARQACGPCRDRLRRA